MDCVTGAGLENRVRTARKNLDATISHQRVGRAGDQAAQSRELQRMTPEDLATRDLYFETAKAWYAHLGKCVACQEDLRLDPQPKGGPGPRLIPSAQPRRCQF
jgi:hypothetical protein